ncbi:hypothetical protein [Microbispora bryophytorum]|uniref:hypothetical protein n=1 Tax=Microbispora bryophytorum TaxID=1460882 RepID=UPI00340BB86C
MASGRAGESPIARERNPTTGRILEEHRRFGPRGFEGVVGQVADIEKALGIYDLSRFTPAG